MRKSLIEWKYRTKYGVEVKSYDIKDKQNGEIEILFKNKIRIVNNSGSFEVPAESIKFGTTVLALASTSDESDNERLQNFLSDFDNFVYTQAQENENNTTHQGKFFER
jgi:hypothetical protein